MTQDGNPYDNAAILSENLGLEFASLKQLTGVIAVNLITSTVLPTD